MENCSNEALAYDGVFTPGAEVVCERCMEVGNNPKASGRYPQPRAAPTNEGDVLGRCDRCSMSVWVREDVAMLQRAKRSINMALHEHVCYLEQTGGMCCGLKVPLPSMSWLEGKRRYLMVVDNEESDGLYMMGLYEEVVGGNCIDMMLLEKATISDIIVVLTVLRG